MLVFCLAESANHVGDVPIIVRSHDNSVGFVSPHEAGKLAMDEFERRNPKGSHGLFMVRRTAGRPLNVSAGRDSIVKLVNSFFHTLSSSDL